MRSTTYDMLMARSSGRRGLILPFVLLVIAFLALLSSGFSWLAQADHAAAEAGAMRTDARLAAESGLQRVLAMLASGDGEFKAWYDNEAELGRQLIWRPGIEETFTGDHATVDDLEEGDAGWLYSIVADDPGSDEPLSVRYGLTDEASKLHLNVMSGEQMRVLIRVAVPHAEELDLDSLVDAFEDWRDSDEEVRPSGAEKSYYESLRPPYKPTNGRFRTVEELLMVRGFTAEIMWGEDPNRNGILDANEDDGEESFPEDDADGELLRGVGPYLTVWSRESEASSGGQAKVNMNSANEAALATVVSQEIAAYIVAARAAGYTFGSPADLLDGSKAPAVRDPEGGEMIRNPVTPTDLPALMDALTASAQAPSVGVAAGAGSNGAGGSGGSEYDGLPRRSPDAPPGMPLVDGRVNINTAPSPVLRALGVFSAEEINSIVRARKELDDSERASLGWLTSRGGVSAESFSQAAPHLTTRAEVFTIESVGYASHLGVMSRLQAVVEIRFQMVPYFMYFRDVSALGPGYPVRALLLDREERERDFGRSRQRT